MTSRTVLITGATSGIGAAHRTAAPRPRPHGGAPSYALPPGPVAETICFALDQPAGVDLNTLTVRPIGQPV